MTDMEALPMIATPTASGAETKQSRLDVLIKQVQVEPNWYNIHDLWGYLVDKKESLTINVSVVGEPSDIPPWSSVPLITASVAANTATWDGKQLSFKDAAARVGPRKHGKNLNVRYYIDPLGSEEWSLILTPSEDTEFVVKFAEITETVMSGPLAAAFISLLLENPDVFQTSFSTIV